MYLSDKLKFLADLHHPVWEIGQKNHKPIDLQHIQDMINSARYEIFLNNNDNENENVSTTPNMNNYF